MKTLDTLIRQSEERFMSKFFSGVYSVTGILIEKQIKSFLSSEIRRVVEEVMEELEIEHQKEMERTVKEVLAEIAKSVKKIPIKIFHKDSFTNGIKEGGEAMRRAVIERLKDNSRPSRLQIQKKGKERE